MNVLAAPLTNGGRLQIVNLITYSITSWFINPLSMYVNAIKETLRWLGEYYTMQYYKDARLARATRITNTLCPYSTCGGMKIKKFSRSRLLIVQQG